jgi:hypothetical protein
MGVFCKVLVEVAFVAPDVVAVSDPTTAGDAALGELLLVAAEDPNAGAVEVELTKGNALAM